MHTALAILLKSKKPLPVTVIAQAIAKMVMRAKAILITFRMTPFFMQSHSSIKLEFVAQFSYSNYTIKLVNNSTATLDYMRKVRTVFCPDFLAQYKSIPLWRSTVFGWTALDPVLTQNGMGMGRAGRKQWKTHRTNGGKKHKSEPKQF